MSSGVIKLLIGVITLSFIGIKFHPELNEPSFFIKPVPNFKFQYYSPLSENGLHFEELSKEQQKEELSYQKFVGDYLQGNFADTLSPIIIAFMSFLIISGAFSLIVSRKSRNRNSWKRMLTAYLGNLLIFFLMFSIYWNFKPNGALVISAYFVLCILFVTLLYTRSFRRKYKKITSKIHTVL